MMLQKQLVMLRSTPASQATKLSLQRPLNMATYLSMNNLVHTQMFGFTSFRKRLGVYSYKVDRQHRFKNPHAVPLHQMNVFKKQGYRGELKLRDLERNSDRPFGKSTRKGNFIFDIDKVPFYNIPDLSGFKVRLLIYQ